MMHWLAFRLPAGKGSRMGMAFQAALMIAINGKRGTGVQGALPCSW